MTQMEVLVLVISIIITWILFGIACAVIATNKGRSGGGWFVLGFLLGPFGLILALVVPKNQEALDEGSIQSGEMKLCPYCAELIKTAAIKCRFCGEDLTENQPSDLSDTRPGKLSNIQKEVPNQRDSRAEVRQARIDGAMHNRRRWIEHLAEVRQARIDGLIVCAIFAIAIIIIIIISVLQS